MDYRGNEEEEFPWVLEADLAEFWSHRGQDGHTRKLIQEGRRLLGSMDVDFPLVLVASRYRQRERLRDQIDPGRDGNIVLCTPEDVEWKLRGYHFFVDVLIDNY